MILLKKIKLVNFLSHISTEIEFTDKFSISIEGASGSGKSSIVEAIVFCLFNEGRGNSRLLIHKGKEKATVGIELKDNDNIYRIERSISSKGKHELIVTEKEGNKFVPVKVSGKKNIQEYLEKEIIKCSYLLFINSALYPQDSSESFVCQTANKRKEILLEIIKAESFNEYYKKSRELLKETNELLISLGVKKDMVNNSISEDKLIKDALKDVPAKLLEINKIINDLRIKKDSLSEKIKLSSILKTKLDNNNLKISGTKDNVIKIESSLSDIEKKLLDIKNSESEKIKDNEKLKDYEEKSKEFNELKILKDKLYNWNIKKSELQSQVPTGRDFDSEEEENKKQIDALNKKEIMQCPELNKPCPVFNKEKESQISFYKKRINEIEAEKNDFMNMMSDYQLKLKELGEQPEVDLSRFRELELELSNLDIIKNRLESDKKNNEFKLEEINKQKTSKEKELIEEKERLNISIADGLIIEEELKEYEKVEKEFSEILIEIDTNTSKHNSLLSDNTRLEDSNNRINKNKKELANIKSSIIENEEKGDGLKMLKDAFGSKGIQDILIEWSLPQLEDRINDALQKTSDFKIILSTQKDSITGINAKDGLWITVINELGDEMSYEQFSGGEKIKIKAAVSEGLASLSKIKFRILDELFVSLDEESSEKFLEVATSLKENVNQLLVISHLPSVKDIFNDKINIIKLNGVSKIK